VEAPSGSWQHIMVDGFAALSIVVLSGGPGWAFIGRSAASSSHMLV
jgi:hypothetical protein